MFERHLEAVCRVGVDQLAVTLVRGADGGEAVGVRARSRDETILRHRLHQRRASRIPLRVQIKPAVALQRLPQRFDGCSIAPGQIKHEPLKVGRLGNIH